MGVRSYKDLIVWQKGIDFVEKIYLVSRKFPREEIYGLTSQIRRAAVSIPSNIAEGQARKSTAEFRNFLSIARGSLAEVETHLLIARRLDYLTQQQVLEMMDLHQELSKMLSSLLSKLSSTG